MQLITSMTFYISTVQLTQPFFLPSTNFERNYIFWKNGVVVETDKFHKCNSMARRFHFQKTYTFHVANIDTDHTENIEIIFFFTRIPYK